MQPQPESNYWKFLIQNGGVCNYLFQQVAFALSSVGLGKVSTALRRTLAAFGKTYKPYSSGSCGGYRGWYEAGPGICVAFVPCDSDELQWTF